MTLIDIRNELLTHFLSNDTFYLSSDSKKIKLSKGQEPFKSEIIKTVLDDMVEDGMCNYVKKDEDVIYVLAVPLSAQSQKVDISSATAEAIANLLKQYTEANGITDYVIDKMSISDNDIRNVLGITGELLESQDKEE